MEEEFPEYFFAMNWVLKEGQKRAGGEERISLPEELNVSWT